MGSKSSRPFFWAFLFAMPSCAVAAFFLWVVISDRIKSSVPLGHSTGNESLVGLFTIISAVELMAASIAYSSRDPSSRKVFMIGVGVFFAAAFGNIVGTIAICFAGCACAK